MTNCIDSDRIIQIQLRFNPFLLNTTRFELLTTVVGTEYDYSQYFFQ